MKPVTIINLNNGLPDFSFLGLFILGSLLLILSNSIASPDRLYFYNGVKFLLELVLGYLVLIKLHHKFIFSFLLVQIPSDIELLDPQFSQLVLELSQFFWIWFVLLVFKSVEFVQVLARELGCLFLHLNFYNQKNVSNLLFSL